MKREPLGNEHDKDRWLGTMLGGSAAPTDACLDAETLAAWADDGLDAKASAAVELHASNCPRCTAVLATMARTAPAATARHAWTPARLVRWLVPLMAAATAIAIWIAVPDRPVTPVQPAPAHDLSTGSEPGAPTVEQGTATAKQGTPDAAFGTANAERGNANAQSGTATAEPGTRNLEPRVELRADAPSVRQEELQLRDEFRRERVAPAEAQDAAAAAPAAAAPVAGARPEAAAPRAAAGSRAAAPTAAAEPPSPFAAEVQTETLKETTQSVARTMAVATDSISPSNPQVRWRIIDAMFVERSTNGGKTWTRTTPPPGTVVAVRAVDANRAVVRTSNSAEFYTTNAGRSWTRVQENSVAPF